MKLIAKVAEIVVPNVSVREVADDPDDDRILECAVAGHADIIVSGDQHLLRLKSFRGISVVSPTDFARMLGIATAPGRRSSSRSSADTRRF
jgi:predicted nucleic acid-binding protein